MVRQPVERPTVIMLFLFLGLITGSCDTQADRFCSDHNPEACCDCHQGLRFAIPFEYDSALITCADGYKKLVFPGIIYDEHCASPSPSPDSRSK